MPDELFALPKMSETFVGRRTELNWLESEIRGGARGFPDRPIVVMGAPGIGKTAIVGEFVRRFETRRQVIWIISREFERDASAFDEAMRSRTSEDSFRDVSVVLDGADEIPKEKLREAFRRVVNFKRVRTVIVTSRYELQLRGERVLRLESLLKADAQSLIEKQFTGFLSHESILKVAGIVNGHPLTLSLIAKMAESLDPEQFRRALDGHLYDLNDDSAAEKKSLIAVA
jgi:tetraacyldisaccharide-1-P 4'-kinase